MVGLYQVPRHSGRILHSCARKAAGQSVHLSLSHGSQAVWLFVLRPYLTYKALSPALSCIPQTLLILKF